MQFLKQEDLDVILSLKIQPSAKRTGIVGVYNQTALKLAIQAPPVEGKANEALIKFLSKTAHLPQSQITLVRGELSKEKKVCLHFDTPVHRDEFIQFLQHHPDLDQ